MNYVMRKLCESLKNDEYKITEFRAILVKNTNIDLWIANGWEYLQGYHCNIKIPFYLKPYVWHLLKKYQFSKWYDKQFS